MAENIFIGFDEALTSHMVDDTLLCNLGAPDWNEEWNSMFFTSPVDPTTSAVHTAETKPQVPTEIPKNAVQPRKKPRTANKKYECNFMGPRGRACRQKFRRQEHLKRHRDIHASGGNNWACPDPDCTKTFKNRTDNLLEHFKTHLRESCTRNMPRTFNQFYEFIRAEYGADGETYVKKLQNWEENGGHKTAPRLLA
jgi:hypothetical protein